MVVVVAALFSRSISYAAPSAPILYGDDGGHNQIAFNHARLNTTTPTFRVSATDTGNFNRFQLELNTAADFTGTAHTQTFTGVYSSGTQYNLSTTSALGLPTTDGAVYYVRVRASNDSGSSWGSWSSNVWTYTYKAATTTPDWRQTSDAQFNTGTLTGTATTGAGAVAIAGAGTAVPSNPFARYRASSLSLANNDPVASWTDEGSGGYNLSQASSPARPTYKATAFNGHPAIEFDGLTDFLQTTAYASPLAQPTTIVALGEWITVPSGGDAGYLWDGQSSSDRNTLLLDSAFGSPAPWRMFAGSVVTGAGAPAAGTDISMVGIYDGASSDIFINNIDSFSSSSPGTNSLGGLTFGARFDGAATASPGHLRIVEVLVYNRALGSTERAALQNYFVERYASSSTAGTIMADPISYDSVAAADSWGEFDWSADETNGSIRTRLYYSDSATCDTLIPDSDLAGNAAGFTGGPVDISDLDPATYSEICPQATFTNFGGSPLLEDWNVTWLSANDAPNTPTTLQQTAADGTSLAVGAWHNDTTVKFTASATDQDNPDALRLCIEARPIGTAFTNTDTTCGTAVAEANTPITVTAQLSGLGNGTQYHWQARLKDAAGAASAWASFGGNAESQRDFGIATTTSTVTTPSSGQSTRKISTNGSSPSATAAPTPAEATPPPSGQPTVTPSPSPAVTPADPPTHTPQSTPSSWSWPLLLGGAVALGLLLWAVYKLWLAPRRLS